VVNISTPIRPQAGQLFHADLHFHGQKRSNDTHASATDPDARLYRKGRGKEAKLCFMGHLLMENRSALIVDAELTARIEYLVARSGLAADLADRAFRNKLSAVRGTHS
jgi:hypothetical protein